MKVKCIKIVNPMTGHEEQQSDWLTLGKVYTVLAVISVPGRETLLRFVSDDEDTPSVFDARQFITVSTELPSNWVGVVNEDGLFVLAPESWTRGGFWEDFFNGVPEAISEYERERAKIVAEAL